MTSTSLRIRPSPGSNFLRAVWVSLFGLFITASWARAFSPEKASFSIECKGDVWPYRVGSLFVLPGERVVFRVVGGRENARFQADARAGEFLERGDRVWAWRAPQKTGLYTLRMSRVWPVDEVLLNVFVMMPYRELKGQYLNGYRIGRYPSIPLRNLPIYAPPRGFIEVTRQNETARLSPHFTLTQLVCRQPGPYTKYVVIRGKLILKLERILGQLNNRGYACDTFAVMSGYRTPHYNRQIGNGQYSRHLWGGAADIFVDERPRDGQMDDLNKDGVENYKDAVVMYEMIDALFKGTARQSFFGGLSWYKKNRHHGPFVHVDVRGKKVRWKTDGK